MTKLGDEPLAREHGGPVRFMLPGHYAMKSVKWLIRIEGVTAPFDGHFVNGTDSSVTAPLRTVPRSH